MRSLKACALGLWGGRPSPWLAYSVAIVLAAAAQLSRLPLHPPTLMPYITYAPFLILSAWLSGLGPGLVTTALCTLESLYFATEPLGSLAVADPRDWLGVGLLAFSGLVASLSFERLRRHHESLRRAMAKLAVIYQNAPMPLLVVDEQLRIRRWTENREKSGAWSWDQSAGVGLGDALGCCEALANPQGCGHGPSCCQCALRAAALDTVRTGTRHDGLEVCLQTTTADGVRPSCMLVSTIPLGVGSLQAVIWAQDISERKQAEEKLHESQTRLAAVLAESEAARSLSAAVFTAQTDPIMVCGADGIVMRTNPAANDTWGFDPTGRHFTDVMAKLGIPGGLGASLTQRALNGETIVNEEQKAGERILETSSAPMRDSEGRIIGAVVVPRDVTRRQQMREALLVTVRELESALGEKTVLLKEVHHRVKNNLAVISSLLNMKAEATGIDETRQALADSQQRVRSIALIHEHLYGRKYLNLINFAEYTQELLQELVQIQVSDPGRIVIQSNVQRIEMGVHRAVPCALIFNELVSNAFKHAFPGERRGRVRVGFGESQPGFLELSVEDNGIGCPACAGEGETKSLGLRIVHILARQLDGTFRQEPCAGTRFVLRFPAGSSRRI